jgi:predicted GIY-YIG superfamily endonuclease
MTGVALYLICCIYKRQLVNITDFIDWALRGLKSFWIIFFSFFLGLFIVAMMDHPPFSEGWLMFFLISILFAIGLIQALFIKQEPKIKTIEKIVEIEKVVAIKEFIEVPVQPSPNKKLGIIYVLRRKDGIIKIGKTYNLRERLSQHKSDYGQEFGVIASWIVPRLSFFESMAIEMTKIYYYQEGNRQELRQMSEEQLSNFVLDFTSKVQRGFNG